MGAEGNGKNNVKASENVRCAFSCEKTYEGGREDDREEIDR